MPTKAKLPQNKTVTLASPVGGVSRVNAREQQRTEPGQRGEPPTCWNSLNMLPYDNQYGRGRVGQRFGIEKAFTPQLGTGTATQVQGMLPVNFITYRSTTANPHLIPGPAFIPGAIPGTTFIGGTTGSTFPHAVFGAFQIVTTGLLNQVSEASFDISAWNTTDFGGGTATSLQVIQGTTQGITTASLSPLLGVHNAGIGGPGTFPIALLPSPAGGSASATATVNAGNTIIAVNVTSNGAGYNAADNPITIKVGVPVVGTFSVITGIAAGLTFQDNTGHTVLNIAATGVANPYVGIQPVTFVGAFGFLDGTWAIFTDQTKSALVSRLNSIGGSLSPGFTNTSNLTSSSQVPPAIPISQGNAASITDLAYP